MRLEGYNPWLRAVLSFFSVGKLYFHVHFQIPARTLTQALRSLKLTPFLSHVLLMDALDPSLLHARTLGPALFPAAFLDKWS